MPGSAGRTASRILAELMTQQAKAARVSISPGTDSRSPLQLHPGQLSPAVSSVPPGSALPFFLPNRHALRASGCRGQKDPALHERVIALRKQNCSIYDIPARPAGAR